MQTDYSYFSAMGAGERGFQWTPCVVRRLWRMRRLIHNLMTPFTFIIQANGFHSPVPTRSGQHWLSTRLWFHKHEKAQVQAQGHTQESKGSPRQVYGRTSRLQQGQPRAEASLERRVKNTVCVQEIARFAWLRSQCACEGPGRREAQGSRPQAATRASSNGGVNSGKSWTQENHTKEPGNA